MPYSAPSALIVRLKDSLIALLHGRTCSAHTHLHANAIGSVSHCAAQSKLLTSLHGRGSCEARLLLLSTLQLQWEISVGLSIW